MTAEKISVRAHREGRYWVFQLDGIGSVGPTGESIPAMGQSRSLKEIDRDARDVAALWLGVEDYSGSIEVVIDLPEDVAQLLSDAERAETEGQAAIARSAQLRRTAARTLTAAHQLSQADAARALHVSPQRMSQLIAESA